MIYCSSIAHSIVGVGNHVMWTISVENKKKFATKIISVLKISAAFRFDFSPKENYFNLFLQRKHIFELKLAK
jgi:hypothetical protein